MKTLSKCQEIMIATGNLLHYLYHQKYYELIGINLSRLNNTSIPQLINFAGKLEEGDGTTMFYIALNQAKTILNFSLDLLVATK